MSFTPIVSIRASVISIGVSLNGGKFIASTSFSLVTVKYPLKVSNSNPRVRKDYLISSFMKCVTGTAYLVSVSVSFVPTAKPHKCWAFHIESLKNPGVSGEFEYN